jgi:penicillin V acylase-like amidase (Ntn superfamily)
MEYINGKLVIRHGKNLSIPVLTNNSYDESIQNLKKYQNFGGNLQLPGGYASLPRFVLAASFLKNLADITLLPQAIAYAFNMLGYVQEPPSSPTPTVWSVVFDLSNKILYYRDIDNAQIRFIHLDNFNLAKDQTIKIVRINNNLSGNISPNSFTRF